MKSLFQKEMNEEQYSLYEKAIQHIKQVNLNLLEEINELINDYKSNRFEITFHLENLSKEEKINYLIKLREKLILMNDCDKVKIKVAQPLHPMCWAYHLSKIFPKNEIFKNFIMYGFCVPFYPTKPIMIAHYVFENGFNEVKDILAHELTHSLMNTKDLNAENNKDAINDAWTLCFLY